MVAGRIGGFCLFALDLAAEKDDGAYLLEVGDQFRLLKPDLLMPYNSWTVLGASNLKLGWG